MAREWILATEAQKKKICEKQKSIMHTKCIGTALGTIMIGGAVLLLIFILHHYAVDAACYDILGYYPDHAPKFRQGIGYWETEETEREEEEFLANQKKEIEAAYAEAKPAVLKGYLPAYIMLGVVCVGIIGVRILYSGSMVKMFQTNQIYYYPMRVTGKSSYRSKYYSNNTLTLKAEDGTVMEDVHTNCFYEVEADDTIILIKTASAIEEYEAVYPASIL